jgi:hypothetical protein
VVEEVVVEGEVAAAAVSAEHPNWTSHDERWDDVDASILDRLPSLLADGLGDLLELLGSGLASPVVLNDLRRKISQPIVESGMSR